MTTPLHRTKRVPTSIFLAGCSLLTAAYLVAQAASGPPIIISIEKNQGNVQHQTTGGSGSGGGANAYGGGGGKKGGGGGSGGGKATTDTGVQTVSYTITLRNGTPSLAKGLVVNTHIYTRTANHSNSSSTSSVDDSADSQTVDVPANGKLDIQSKDVSLTNTSSTTPATQGKKGAAGTPAQTTSTNMTVLGIYVEVTFNGKVLAHRSDPSDDDIDKAKQMMNKASGGSSTSTF